MENMQLLENYITELRQNGLEQIAEYAEEIYINSLDLYKESEKEKIDNKWDTIFSKLDIMNKSEKTPEDFFRNFRRYLFYELKPNQKIAVIKLHDNPLMSYYKTIEIPSKQNHGKSIDETIALIFTNGLLDLTQDLVNNNDVMAKISGYGTARLFEQTVREYEMSLCLGRKSVELEQQKEEYKQFRKANFVKPQLNKRWNPKKTWFKGAKICVAIKPVEFKNHKTYYKDMNTVVSLVKKLGGTVAVSYDKTVEYVIYGKNGIPKSMLSCKYLSELNFSDIVKKQMPQIPKGIATPVRLNNINLNDLIKVRNKKNMEEYGFWDYHVNFIYQNIQDMITAVTTKEGEIYKLTRINRMY